MDYLASLNNRDGLLHHVLVNTLQIRSYHTAHNANTPVLLLSLLFLPHLSTCCWSEQLEREEITAGRACSIRARHTWAAFSMQHSCVHRAYSPLLIYFNLCIQTGTYILHRYLCTEYWNTGYSLNFNLHLVYSTSNEKASLLLILLTELHVDFFMVLSATDVIPGVISALSYSYEFP